MPPSPRRVKHSFFAPGWLYGKFFELAKPANVSLWNELSRYFARPEVKEKIAREVEVVAEPERRAFLLANIVSEQLAFRFFQRFVQQMTGGNPVEGIQALTAIAPLLIVLSPYIYGFHSQAPSRKWLREIFQEMTDTVPRSE